MEFIGNTSFMARPARQKVAEIFRELHEMDQPFACTQGMPIPPHGGTDQNEILVALGHLFYFLMPRWLLFKYLH